MTRPSEAGPRRSALISRRSMLAGGIAAGVGSVTRVEAARAPRWFDQRRLGPFQVRATYAIDDQLLRDTDLPGLERELRRVLALRPCTEQIELLLLRDAREHRRVIKARHPEAPIRRALFYKVDKRSVIYAYRHDELAIDLRHEGSHALLHADLPMVPLWLDEGLAEYFEPPIADRARGPGHLESVVAEARRGRVRRLVDLESRRELSQMREVDYRDAWAWTHFLLHGPPVAAQQLWGMLAAIRRFEPPGPMSQRLANALPSQEDAWVTHFRRWPRVLTAAGINARVG